MPKSPSTWKSILPSLRLTKPQSTTTTTTTNGRLRRPSNASSVSSLSSIMSNTSTLEYGHESFATFEKKVEDLLLHIGTLKLSTMAITPLTTITITRLFGGESHRIIGITLTTPAPTEKKKKKKKNCTEYIIDDYILRLPRHEATPVTNLLRAVSVMAHLESLGTVPVPVTIVFDPDGGSPDSDCPLAHPYILQTRLPGKPLSQALPEMTFPQRIKFVKEVVNLLLSLDTIQFQRCGVLVPAPVSLERNGLVAVDSFDIPSSSAAPPSHIRAYPEQTTRDMVLSQLETWRLFWQHQTRSRGEAELAIACIDRLIDVTRDMERRGCLGDNTNILHHPTLSAHKILVEQQHNGDWKISGILGWDDALSVPRIMAHRAPSWLWRRGAAEGWQKEDERHDADIPACMQDAQVKRRFEVEAETALPRFLEYAYRPRFRMVRRLCWFAVWGVRFGEDVRAVEVFLGEWEGMKADRNFGWEVKGIWGD